MGLASARRTRCPTCNASQDDDSIAGLTHLKEVPPCPQENNLPPLFAIHSSVSVAADLLSAKSFSCGHYGTSFKRSL